MTPVLHRSNFCPQCGVQITRTSWRVWRRCFCEPCGATYGRRSLTQLAVAGLVVLAIGFAAGRCLRPPEPPLVIERSANSRISDLPANLDERRSRRSITAESDSSSANRVAAGADDAIYICGARTKKGMPCRRRVHFAGERCYQHKGRPAMVPLEKLVAKEV